MKFQCFKSSIIQVFSVTTTCRTNLNTGSRQHSVRCKNSSFYAVSQDTLTVAPHSVGGVRCANLARSAKDSYPVNTVHPKVLYFHMAQYVAFNIGLNLCVRSKLDMQSERNTVSKTCVKS